MTSRSPNSVRPPGGSPGGPLRTREPRRLFRSVKMTFFQEWGGYGEVNAPADVSVFNPEEDTFYTLFAEAKRLYLFDTFGDLWEKRSCDVTPFSLAWWRERAECLVGFADSTIGRYTSGLTGSRGRFRLPEGFLPRRIAIAGGDVLISDGSARLVRITPDEQMVEFGPLATAVSDMSYSAAHDCLIVSTSGALIALSRDGRQIWSVPHDAATAAVACARTVRSGRHLAPDA